MTRNRVGVSHHIAGLDGLRALAVVAVIIYHVFPGLLPGGYLGVDIFFVISGFLITTLLISERMATGRIALKGFWVRRARRLLPALFLTILCTASVVVFIRGDILVGIGRQILGAATFSSNWVEVAAGTNYFEASSTHLFLNFWSLAVEEQFYLLWPLLVVAIMSVVIRSGRLKLGIWMSGFAALTSAVWMTTLFLQGASVTRVYYGTDTHVFGLMIGAMIAFAMFACQHGETLGRVGKVLMGMRTKYVTHWWIGAISLGGLALLMKYMPDQSTFAYSGGLLLASLLSGGVLIAVVTRKSHLQRLFSLRPLKWIGARSYGLYLWHWPLLVICSTLFPRSAAVWIVPTLTLTLTYLIAALSHKYVEMPIRAKGLRSILRGIIKRRSIKLDEFTTTWKKRPHVAVFPILIAVILTCTAIASAPAKTSAQISIEAGQRAIAHAKVAAPTLQGPSATPQIGADIPPSTSPADGANITVIGDSVTLASAEALQAQFPGIFIDAHISRSLRVGGFDTITALQASGQLRPTVVIALSTNGYYGNGDLDKLVTVLAGHNIVLMTGYGSREWITPNNNDAFSAAKKYPNVAIADWATAIAAHEDLLSADHIHPLAAGGTIYAQSIQAALKKFLP